MTILNWTKVRHLKKGDTVVALSGASKGKTGKVLEVNQAKGLVKVEGIGIAKKHAKPSQANPKGGIIDINRWLPACKFQVSGAGAKGLGRVGFKLEGEKKTRVFRKAGKEKSA